LRHSWKVNCLTPKVNTFFGSLLITIFQKQNYLDLEKLTGSPLEHPPHDQ
jgi:hypothetical protein